MFGYVRAYIPELKVKDSEIYKAVYCTLCRELGRSYGIFARLTLSYDFTFLALLSLSLEDECTGFEQRRCTFNPLKKCSYCKNANGRLSSVSASAMIMLYYKLLDNITDSKGAKKLGYRLLLPVFSRPHKKAARLFPETEKHMAQYIFEQNELEKADCASQDRAAEPTAKVLAHIFTLCSQNESEQRVLKRMGYCIGRWVYLMDAAADLEDDKKSGNYNVLLKKDEPFDKIRQELLPSLNMSVGEAARACELLEFKRYGDIIRNIIYLGLPQMQRKNPTKKEKHK